MNMLTLGIDPGITGALALLSADGQLELVADLPGVASSFAFGVDGRREAAA